MGILQAAGDEFSRLCHDCAPGIMAVLATVGFFTVLTLLCFVHVPPENGRIVEVMTSLLSGGWASIVAYFFGSRRR